MGSMSTPRLEAVNKIPNRSPLQHLSSPCRLKAVAAVLFLLSVVGCASQRSRDLRPVVSEEAELRQEVAASESPEPFYQLALFYLGDQRIDEAVLALQESVRRQRDYEPALNLLAKTLQKTGRGLEALALFEGRPVEQWSPAMQINVALLQVEVGNSSEARRILRDNLNGESHDSARASLAYLDLLDEEKVTARQQLEESIDSQIDVPELLNKLAVEQLRSGDIDGSLEVLHRLTSRHREFAVAHINLALLMQHWLFDDKGTTRTQHHLDMLLEPLLSDAVLSGFLDPTKVENAAPPVPPHSGSEPSEGARP